MGTVTKQGSITTHPSSHDTSNYSYASISSSYPITNAYTDSSSTTYCQVNWKTGQNAESYVYLKFPGFDAIPVSATIKTVTAKAKGYVSTTNSSRVTSRQMQLASGTTLMGSALTMSNSASEQTFTSVGDWTRALLQDAGIRYYVKRGTSNTSSNYNFRMYGATMTVTYEWQETTYTITVSNSTAATVTANPDEVVSGGSSEIKASTITGLTITDNGTNITSSFTQRYEPSYSYSVTNVGDYGFALNNNDYYESNNKGIDKTAAVCRVDFDVPVAATITFTFINYAEQGYDFGVFGNIDVALSNNYYAAGSSGATITDNSYRLACNTSTYNKSSNQTLSYSMSSGEHSIWVKYSKDDASAANNDTLQFKVAVSLDEPYTPATYYGYDLTNVSADHTIVVTGGSVPDVIYFKTGGTETLIGEVYVSDADSGTVFPVDLSAFSVGDTCRVTNQLYTTPRGAAENYASIVHSFTWTGQSYTYDTKNGGSDGYTLTITPSSLTIYKTYDGGLYASGDGGGSDKYVRFYKTTGGWVAATKVYKKVNGSWVEQSDLTTVFNANTNYVKGN